MTETLMICGLVTLALYVIVRVVLALCVPEDLK